MNSIHADLTARHTFESPLRSVPGHQDIPRQAFPTLRGDCAARRQDISEFNLLPRIKGPRRPGEVLPLEIRNKIFDFFLKYRWDPAIGNVLAARFGLKIGAVRNIDGNAKQLNVVPPETLEKMRAVVSFNSRAGVLKSSRLYQPSHLSWIQYDRDRAVQIAAATHAHNQVVRLPDDSDQAMQEHLYSNVPSTPDHLETTRPHVSVAQQYRDLNERGMEHYLRLVTEIERRSAAASESALVTPIGRREKSAFRKFVSEV